MPHEPGGFGEEQLGDRQDIRLLGRLLPYAAGYKFHFLVSVLLVVLITLLELSVPYITKLAIDRHIVPRMAGPGHPERNASGETIRSYYGNLSNEDVADVADRYPALFHREGGFAVIAHADLPRLAADDVGKLRQDDLKGVTRMAGLLLLIVCGNFGLVFCQAMVMEYTGQMMMHRLRVDLFTHIQKRSVAFFTRNPVGRLVTRVTSDIQNMHEMFTSVVSFIFQDLFLLAGITVILLLIHFKLACICLLLLPLMLRTAYRFADVARGAFRTLRVKIAEINTRFSETVQGMHIVQLFRHETENYRTFESLNHEHYLAGMKQVHVFAVFMPLIELLGSVALALVIYFGGIGTMERTISLGDLVAFISYMRMFFRPIRDMAEKFNILQNAMSSAERIFLILDNRDQEEHPVIGHGGAALAHLSELSFEEVHFAYNPRETVLTGVSFTIRAGETLAIVGPTGAGKTSLINLIVGFYKPESGRILLNGRDIRSYPLSSVRKRIALVPQDPFLFSGTVRENLFAGQTGLTRPEMDRVLDAANCRDLVERLPDGIDTELSESGESLSSGERQLLSIARAFAANPDLIILDEATSYIDSASERRIQLALDNLLTNRTAIIIAHRLSTARTANRILTLHHGRIIESGTHEELMKSGGFYYNLNRMER
ncbi:MAG: ABC transporter ATP-binding protein [Thermodesulfobacteriota bacterium]